MKEILFIIVNKIDFVFNMYNFGWLYVFVIVVIKMLFVYG